MQRSGLLYTIEGETQTSLRCAVEHYAQAHQTEVFFCFFLLACGSILTTVRLIGKRRELSDILVFVPLGSSV